MTKRTVLRLYKSRTSPVTIQSISQIFEGNKNEVSSAGDFPGPVLAIVGDIGSLINSVWTGSDLASQNPELLVPGADASGIFSQVLRRAHIRKSRYSKLTKKRPTKGKWSRKQREPRVSGKPRG